MIFLDVILSDLFEYVIEYFTVELCRHKLYKLSKIWPPLLCNNNFNKNLACHDLSKATSSSVSPQIYRVRLLAVRPGRSFCGENCCMGHWHGSFVLFFLVPFPRKIFQVNPLSHYFIQLSKQYFVLSTVPFNSFAFPQFPWSSSERNGSALHTTLGGRDGTRWKHVI